MPWPLMSCGIADHRGFGDRRMQHQGRFDLGGAHAVAGDVDHVVHPPGDPVVAVRVAAGAVAGEVQPLVHREIGFDEALMITVHGAHDARPRPGDDQIAIGGAFQELALGIHQGWSDAEKRPGGGAGLQGGGAGQRGDQNAAGFRLPPGIHDRTARIADVVVVPLPGLGVDRLAHRAQQPQALARGGLDRTFALPHQRADRGRGGVEDVNLVLVHHLPEAAGVRVGRDAFEHQGDGAVGQWPVDDVGVAGDPAHVSGAPENVAVVIIEDVLVSDRRVQQITTGGVQHALGLAGGAGSVEDEQRILGIHGFRRAVGGSLSHQFVIPQVAAFDPGDVAAGALDHHGLLHARRTQHGLVDIGLHRHLAAAAQTLVGGDHHRAGGVDNAVLQRIRREATEYNGVNGADPGAGQHGDRGFGNHRHVNADPIPFLDAQSLQDVGELADVFVQLPVGDFLVFLGVVTFPDDGDLIAAGRQMAVQAVVADVELGALEPANVALGEIPVQHLVPGLEPSDELIGLLRPEALRVIDRALVHFFILRVVDPGMGGDVGGYGIDLDVGHDRVSPLVGDGVVRCAAGWRRWPALRSKPVR